LVLLFLATLSILSVRADGPPIVPPLHTSLEAETWMRSITLLELDAYVLRWSAIENGLPTTPDLKFSAIMDKNGDLYVDPVYPKGQDYYDLHLGDLMVKVKIGQQFYPGFYVAPPPSIWHDIIVGTIAFLIGGGIGFVAGTVLHL
jgi:hypothetical protein